MLVLGKVTGGKLLDSEAEPMSYRETGSMTAPLRYFPTRSVIKTWANTVPTRPTFLAADACFGGISTPPRLEEPRSDAAAAWVSSVLGPDRRLAEDRVGLALGFG